MSRIGIATSIFAVLVACVAAGCDKGADKGSSSTTSAASSAITVTTSSAKPEATPSATASAAAGGSKKEPIVTFKGVGLETPESVLYDDANDVYIVSNINGKPTDLDNNGFISKLSPDGKVQTLKWIEGGKNKVTLNAPKGLAVVGDNLYVADVDTVRIFDKKTGAPAGDVKVPGATFLNDVASTSDGRVLVSDSGLKAGKSDLEPSGTDAVYAIDKAKKLTTIAKSKDLGAPNGLLAMGDKTWVVTFGSGELYSLDAKGKKADPQKLPKGTLDGIVALPDGDVLISSWESSSVFRGKPGGEFKEVVENVKSPADIGYDTKRSRLLVPIFMGNEVQVFDLK